LGALADPRYLLSEPIAQESKDQLLLYYHGISNNCH